MDFTEKPAENANSGHGEPVRIVDWLSQGESCELKVGGVQFVVRFIGRKGRRARISVVASQKVPGDGDEES